MKRSPRLKALAVASYLLLVSMAVFATQRHDSQPNAGDLPDGKALGVEYVVGN